MKINWQNVAEQTLGTILATALIGAVGWILFPDSIPETMRPIGQIAVVLAVAVVMWLFFRRWLQKLGAVAALAIGWWARQWRYNLVAVLLLALEWAVYSSFQSLAAVLFSLLHFLFIGLVLGIFRFKGGVHRTQLTYDAKTALAKWKSPAGWGPTTDGSRIQLTPHDSLTRVLLCEDVTGLVNGTIECEVFLEPEALLNVLFRGELEKGEFYMARLDARPRNHDCILYKPHGTGWREINPKAGADSNSPHSQWLTMRIVIRGQSIKLYRDGRLVDHVDSAAVVPGQVGIFAEVANAYIRRISISQ